MAGSEPTPVRIRGHDFPSIKSAAAVLGVDPNKVRKALDEGDVDRLTICRRCGTTRQAWRDFLKVKEGIDIEE